MGWLKGSLLLSYLKYLQQSLRGIEQREISLHIVKKSHVAFDLRRGLNFVATSTKMDFRPMTKIVTGWFGKSVRNKTAHILCILSLISICLGGSMMSTIAVKSTKMIKNVAQKTMRGFAKRSKPKSD